MDSDDQEMYEREPSTTESVDPPERKTSKLNKILVETKESRYKSFVTRFISTIAMITAFIGIIYLGHVPLVILVFTLQWLMVKELFSLARKAQKEKRLPGFRAQQWYFFFVATFYLYLRFAKNNLLVELTSTKRIARFFSWVLRRHTIISYCLYLAGFVSFVLSLKKGMYMYQFGQYAWTHMALMFIFVPSAFFVSNIFEGLIWFLLPSALIIVNDIMAYLAGFFFGRTPLIKLSPKKTWEGFIGGFVGTAIASFFLAHFMSQFKWMTCPRKDLSLGSLDCVPDDFYNVQEISLMQTVELLPPLLLGRCRALAALLPQELQHWLATATIHIEPIQVHAVVLACFASLIAPFGGFFASGFKRAFNMKDFGDTIPGHGGVTDRFDCQMMMAMFSYLYYWNYVSKPELSVGEVLQVALRLGPAQQVEVFARLGNLLISEGLLNERYSLPLLEVARQWNVSTPL